MTDRPSERPTPATGFDDPTRDIRLPPLPGRPASAVPAEWAAQHQQPESPLPEPQQPEPQQPEPQQPEPQQPAPPPIADQPTDEHEQPPAAVRQRTLAFAAPSAGDGNADVGRPVQAPPGHPSPGHLQPGALAPSSPAARPGSRPRRRRRMWPWVVVLLVLMLLFAAAVVLAWVGGEQDGLQSWWESAAPLGYRAG